MGQFRKKPVVIEAVQVVAEGAERPMWLQNALRAGVVRTHPRDNQGALYMTVSTLEGVMTANEHDWIIQGVRGELYPCKPDIFAATYEAV